MPRWFVLGELVVSCTFGILLKDREPLRAELFWVVKHVVDVLVHDCEESLVLFELVFVSHSLQIGFRVLSKSFEVDKSRVVDELLGVILVLGNDPVMQEGTLLSEGTVALVVVVPTVLDAVIALRLLLLVLAPARAPLAPFPRKTSDVHLIL